MAYYVRSPGTCGEFIQGSIDGQSFLVTCPINRYSYALSDVAFPLPHQHCSLQPKSNDAKRLVEQLLASDLVVEEVLRNSKPFRHMMGHNIERSLSVYVRSDILQGKGMASSSADIAAAAMATSLALGKPLSLKELESICLALEPTDASFYPGSVQFDYINGKISQSLGPCPPVKILIFDEGGTIDTIRFNEQEELPAKIKEKEPIVTEALSLFIKGLAERDISLIGEAATLSAFGNQRILYKPHLYDFHNIGINFGSAGTIIAHSGTIMGLLFPTDSTGIDECKQYITLKLPKLTYVDTVETTNEGLTYIKR